MVLLVYCLFFGEVFGRFCRWFVLFFAVSRCFLLIFLLTFFVVLVVFCLIFVDVITGLQLTADTRGH